MEYAATLGMVDVAYISPLGARQDYGGEWGADDLVCLSRYDGLFHFRLTAPGAYCLGLSDSYVPARDRGGRRSPRPLVMRARG